jgi:hypothetical protein
MQSNSALKNTKASDYHQELLFLKAMGSRTTRHKGKRHRGIKAKAESKGVFAFGFQHSALGFGLAACSFFTNDC